MNVPSLRVLYLNHAAKPSGAEFALWRMLGAVNRDQVQPTILFGEEGPAVEFMREIGIETHVLPLPEQIREVRKDSLGLSAFMNFRRASLLLKYAVRVAEFARRHAIQIIHTNTIKAHIYGALAGHLSGLPVVWHLRDYVNETYFPWAAVKFVRFLAKRAPKHIIGVSGSVMEQLHLGDSDGRSTVILDGLSEQELSTEIRPKSRQGQSERFRVGIVGRLAQWKGQHVFIDAAAKVLAAGFDVEFAIIGAPLFGEEDYEAALRRQAAALGLGDRIRFVGFTRDVPGELRKVDILVHASTTGEPFGQVIIEGMAIGLPVIASRGGGVPEIISDGENGILTPMGDAAALSDALISLLRDPEMAARLGRAGYAHVRKHFRAAQGARKVENVYKSIEAGKNVGELSPAPWKRIEDLSK